MKQIALLLILSFISSTAFTEVPYKFYGPGDPEEKKIWELVKTADMVIHYAYDTKVDIGVGSVDAGSNARTPITFYLPQLENYFDQQKHKNLVVVFFDKRSPLSEEPLHKSIEKLNSYFSKRNYKRIILLQGLGDGVGLYSDIINPNIESKDGKKLTILLKPIKLLTSKSS